MVLQGIRGVFGFTSTIVSTVKFKNSTKKIENYTTITSMSEEDYSGTSLGEGKCIGWVWLNSIYNRIYGYLVGNCMIRARFYLGSFFSSLDFFSFFFSTSFFCFLSPNVCIHCCLLGYRIVRDGERTGVKVLFCCFIIICLL